MILARRSTCFGDRSGFVVLAPRLPRVLGESSVEDVHVTLSKLMILARFDVKAAYASGVTIRERISLLGASRIP